MFAPESQPPPIYANHPNPQPSLDEEMADLLKERLIGGILYLDQSPPDICDHRGLICTTKEENGESTITIQEEFPGFWTNIQEVCDLLLSKNAKHKFSEAPGYCKNTLRPLNHDQGSLSDLSAAATLNTSIDMDGTQLVHIPTGKKDFRQIPLTDFLDVLQNNTSENPKILFPTPESLSLSPFHRSRILISLFPNLDYGSLSSEKRIILNNWVDNLTEDLYSAWYRAEQDNDSSWTNITYHLDQQQQDQEYPISTTFNQEDQTLTINTPELAIVIPPERLETFTALIEEIYNPGILGTITNRTPHPVEKTTSPLVALDTFKAIWDSGLGATLLFSGVFLTFYTFTFIIAPHLIKLGDEKAREKIGEPKNKE